MKYIKLKGKIKSGFFGKDSKSEHTALFIDTGDNKYRIKMQGGNPFYDKKLHKLIGKNIEAKGCLSSHFFEIIEINIDTNKNPK